MKTFKDLKLGDRYYYCFPDSHTYKSEKVTSISTKELKHDSYYTINNMDVSIIKIHESSRYTTYPKTIIFFVNECDVIRYCKAQGIKHLRKLIMDAEDAINKVKEFRFKNFEDLNVNWLETKINKLEATHL